MPAISKPVQAPPPLDFVKIDGVREHLKLRPRDMAELFGVSRMTYYRWVKGGTVQRHHQTPVRHRLRQLIEVARNGWPDEQAMRATADDRIRELILKLD